MEMSKSPAGMVKLSAAVTDLVASSASEPRKFPPVEASQKETWLYVSVVLTFVQARSAEVVIAPPEATENVACLRVVSPAGLPAPAAPGSPMCNLTQKAAGSE